MATLFSGSINARASSTSVLALASPSTGVAVVLKHDVEVDLSISLSIDGGTIYADPVSVIDSPLPDTAYETLLARGCTHAKLVLTNASDTLCNALLQAVAF